MAAKIPQTLEYRGDQLNVALILGVENFTNWKKRSMCHIIGIKPLFKSIIQDGPYVSMIAGNRKPESQWNADERKAANLDQRLKSLIVSVLPDDQINYDFQDSPNDEEDAQPEIRPTKDFEAKYNKVKAKLALISSGASTSKSSMVKNKGLVDEAYE
ncbi:hypothetical protein Tco_0020033 [Tanacetum coccineum]